MVNGLLESGKCYGEKIEQSEGVPKGGFGRIGAHCIFK